MVYAESVYSQEEITHRVELEYRHFLSIDSKFRPLAFFYIQYGRRHSQIGLSLK